MIGKLKKGSNKIWYILYQENLDSTVVELTIHPEQTFWFTIWGEENNDYCFTIETDGFARVKSCVQNTKMYPQD